MDGLPWLHATVTGSLWASIAKAMQRSCADKLRLLACLKMWGRSVSAMLGLIEAGALAEDDSVLVAIDRRKDSLPLLPGYLVGDA